MDTDRFELTSNKFWRVLISTCFVIIYTFNHFIWFTFSENDTLSHKKLCKKKKDWGVYWGQIRANLNPDIWLQLRSFTMRASLFRLYIKKKKIFKKGTGKSLSEALLFAKHVENMLCTKFFLNVGNNLCTQHVFPRFELGLFTYWTCNSMNNLWSYCRLVDAKIRAPDKDLPVAIICIISYFGWVMFWN